MGTEEHVVSRGPCRCGGGEFLYLHYEPDHGWPTKSGYSTDLRITCAACDKKYALTFQDEHVIVVDKTAYLARHQEREARESAWHRKRTKLLKSDAVQARVGEFIARIAALPSAAAMARALRPILHVGGDDTFRRNIRKEGGVGKWLGKGLDPGHLKPILDYLGVSDETIEAEIVEVDRLWQRSKEPLEPLVPNGEPIYWRAHPRDLC